jgi:hypothetical protein
MFKIYKPAGRRIGQGARLFLRIAGASIEPFTPAGPKICSQVSVPQLIALTDHRSAGTMGHEPWA